jgi:L-rhamnose isomerase/sugar isomerase
MIDASHNVKDPLEDLIQSVEAIKIAYTQALLVDRKALVKAQAANDVVTCQEILQAAFRTDVRAIVAESRLRRNGAINPLGLYRSLNVREELIKERGANSAASGL